mgnify:FL=1
MKNNLAPIIMIAMYIVMMVKCKKIYLNISRDYALKHINRFKQLIYLSAVLSVLSCILLLYSSNISNNGIVNEIGFDAFMLSMFLTVYSLHYITDDKKFPNVNKQIVRTIKLSMKSIFILVLLHIISTILILCRWTIRTKNINVWLKRQKSDYTYEIIH